MPIKVIVPRRQVGIVGRRFLRPRHTGISILHSVCLAHTQHHAETLLEVVGQEPVEQWIGAAVCIRQDNGKKIHPCHHAVLREYEHQVYDVDDVERQPAEDKHHHDHHHHAGHLTLGASALRKSRPGSRRLHLDYDEQVTHADDQQGAEESERCGVKYECHRPNVSWLRPTHVAWVKHVLNVREYHHGENNDEGKRPHRCTNCFSYSGSAPT